MEHFDLMTTWNRPRLLRRLSRAGAIYISITVLSIDRHRSNLDYFAGVYNPCIHVATLGDLLMDEGPFRIAATRQFHFDKHFPRIVLKSVPSWTIDFNRDRFERVLSTWKGSSSSLSCFFWTFFFFILSPLLSRCAAYIFARAIGSNFQSRLRPAPGVYNWQQSNDPTT